MNPRMELTQALIKEKIPLIIAGNLMDIWQEGSPTKFKKLMDEGKMLAKLKSLKPAMKVALQHHSDPQMMHVSLTEKLQMADLPLPL